MGSAASSNPFLIATPIFSPVLLIAVLIGLRTAYSFTPRLYLQSLLQYNDQSDSFSGNIRLAWLNTAGTGLFLVYNDLRNTATFAERGLPEGPLDRTFVVKFTKMLNLGG